VGPACTVTRRHRQGTVLAAEQGMVLVTRSIRRFTDDTRLHQRFLDMVHPAAQRGQ